MSQAAISTPAQGLRQSVRFGERYVSSALNQKLAGILGAGVYHGYVLKPGPAGQVLVGHEDDYPRSVAVVERDGYSLTVIMDDPVYVQIPAPGTWHIVIEAFYVPTQPGYQRIVAREQVEEHHVLLGTVTVEDMSTPITEEQINVSDCAYSNVRDQADTLLSLMLVQASAMERDVRLSDVFTRGELTRIARENDIEVALLEHQQQEVQRELREASQARDALLVLDRITKTELARISIVNELECAQHLLRERADMDDAREAATVRELLRALERITNLELELKNGMATAPTPVFTAAMEPSGYTTVGGATVAPVTIVNSGDVVPSNAAIAFVIG